MSTFHTLTIKQITRETSEAVSIAFAIPENLISSFSFESGQYVTLKSVINNEEVRRAYSICSSKNDGELRVAVKQIENGLFSTYANTQLKEGDQLEVSEPEGKFTLKNSSEPNKNYMAFAAGSGITPIMSMIKTVLSTDTNSSFSLVYGNKTIESAIFYDELEQLKKNYPNRFNSIYVFSKTPVEGQQFGRIDASIVNFAVKNKLKDLVFDSYYLCGPEEMINTVSETLIANGVPKENVLYELFTASTSTNEVSTGNFNSVAATVLVDDEELQVEFNSESLLLDAFLKENMDVPYSCQGGVCSSCIARITEGKATMVKNSILTDDEIADGLVLTCQSIAQTAKITVDYDDV